VLKFQIEIQVSFLFELGVKISGYFNHFMEVFMSKTFVKSCVWVGVAFFMPSLVGTLPIQMKEIAFVDV
jgi:hypothetical protein